MEWNLHFPILMGKKYIIHISGCTNISTRYNCEKKKLWWMQYYTFRGMEKVLNNYVWFDSALHLGVFFSLSIFFFMCPVFMDTILFLYAKFGGLKTRRFEASGIALILYYYQFFSFPDIMWCGLKV